MKRVFRIYYFCTMKDSMKLHREMLKSQYEQYKSKQYSKISKPRNSQENYINSDEVNKMQKQAEEQLKIFRDSHRLEFNSKQFIKLIGQISYVYDNYKIIQKPIFKEVLQQAADNIYQFKDMRDVALFINFSNLNNIDNEELWFSLAQQIRNNSQSIDISDQLLILQSTNKYNKEQFEEFFTLFEEKLLKEIKLKHSLIVPLLQVYRQNKYNNDAFYYTIKQYIISNLQEFKMDQILSILQYYGLSQSETIDDRNEILKIIMEHLYKIMQFLNKKQLINVYFIYIRTQQGSDVLYRLIEDRVALMIDEMQLNEMEQLLIIAANQKNYIIFKHAERILQKRLIDTKPSDIVQIAVLFIETNSASPEFLKKLEEHLIPAIYTTSLEELPELLWALVQREENLKWMEKIAEACKERLPQMNLKLLTSIVFMTSDYFKRLSNVKKRESNLMELYEMIEKRLLTLFENCEAELRDVAVVLNAYTRNLPIAQYLIDLFEIYVLNSTKDELLELDGWALSQIVYGFNQLDNYKNTKQILEYLREVIDETLPEMSLEEMFCILQVYVEQKLEKEEMILNSIDKTSFWLDSLSINQIYLGIHIYSNTQFQSEKVEEILKKLIDRLEYLKSVKPVDILDQQLREFEIQEQIKRFRA